MTHNVVHALSPHALMHLLVAVELVCHGPEQTGAVLAHLLDHVALPPHVPLKSRVLLSPLLLGQVLAHVAVLVLAVIPLILLALPQFPSHRGAGHPGGVAVGVARPLGARSPIQSVIIVQLLMGREPLL